MRRVPRPGEDLAAWAVRVSAWIEDAAKTTASAMLLRRGSVSEPGQAGQVQYDGSRVIWHDGAAWAPLGARVSTYANRNTSPGTGELAIFTDGIGGGGSSTLAGFDGANWV